MNEARLHRLLNAYLDDALSPLDSEELRQALLSSPAARQEFRKRTAFHALIYEAAQLKWAPEQAATDVAQPVSLAWSRVESTADHPHSSSMIAGGMVLGIEAYQHFLERFLEGLGRPFHARWWTVHLALYLVTFALFVSFIDLERLFPRAPVTSLALGMLAEFAFGTWMLCHIRRSRSEAFTLVQKITSPDESSVWFRKHAEPFYRGWNAEPMDKTNATVKSAREVEMESSGTHALPSSPGFLAFVVLVMFYGLQFGLGLQPDAPESWRKWLLPHVFWIYTNTVKATVFVALFSHFSWLKGLTALARGMVVTSLSADEKEKLNQCCRTQAVWLNSVLGICMGVWMFAEGLNHGFSWWSLLFSAILGMSLVTQFAIINGVKANLVSFFQFLNRVIASTQLDTIIQPRLGFALLLVICPVALNSFGALVRTR